MTWLAQIRLNHQSARTARLYDTYSWHRRVWESFPGQPDMKRNFLMRVDSFPDGFRAYLLAQTEPMRPAWCPPGSWSLKKIPESFLSYPHYQFDLVANPTKCVSHRTANGAMPRHGRRVAIRQPEELLQWLQRKANASGFRVQDAPPVQIDRINPAHFTKTTGEVMHRGLHAGTQFRGVLTVTDTARFSAAFRTGLGSAKAFGFGMLLLHPIVQEPFHETS